MGLMWREWPYELCEIMKLYRAFRNVLRDYINIFNKKTKEPILMELFTATRKLNFFFTTRDVRCVHHG